MRKIFGLFFVMMLVLVRSVLCQETIYGPGYQTLVMNNPAFAGCKLDGTLRIAYMNFFPGHNYQLHSVYCSYDSYFPVIHGGAGFYISNDYLGGVMNEIRSGFSYAYYMQAGRDLYINAGLSASFYHRGFNLSGAVFPDQIDPLGRISLPTAGILTEQNSTVLDVGTGFMLNYNNFTGGLAILHLNQPSLNRNGEPDERLKRKIVLHMMADFDLNRSGQYKIIPIIHSELQGQYFYTGIGAVFAYNYLSANSVLITDSNKNFDIQAGFSLKWESLALFYNYRFNISSVNSAMPFSTIQQAGLTFSLNKVEKRIKLKTINIPEM